MDYDYDLVSGKVNYFYYQKDKEDQLIHKYEYDGDNRIVKVFTSRDAITWDRDAKYDYYAHGPLAKTTIGEHEVESNTYAYTIQGWIKGVNGNSFSYALGYFNDGVHQDYQGIGGGSNYTLSTAVASGKSLYNGNIATMASKTPQFASQGGADWVQQFEYDQLNRIKQSSSLGWVDANNQPVPDAFKTSYTYDAGGNIDTLIRYDKDGNQFDEMIYNYENTASSQNYKTNTNKLRWVDDTEPVADYDGDIDDQDVGNYTYDDIGNLIADKSEEIEKIEWNYYGIVKKVTRTATSSKPDLEFGYDAMGHRVFKSVKEKGGNVKNTFYITDVKGNTMSIYEADNGSSPVLEEQYVYCASRMATLKPKAINSNMHSIGSKNYELRDYLGNVHVVLSDIPKLDGTNVLSAVDYLPFGMSARSYNIGTYRYGYGSKENENEISQDNYDFGARILSTKLGRWLVIDPHASNYPYINPYSYSLNSPIMFVDPDGEDVFVAFTGAPFGGGNTVNPNEASTTGEIMLEIQLEAVKRGVEFDGTVITPGWTAGSSIDNAYAFVKANYVSGEKLIIYGYSYGGDFAVELAEKLKADGIVVDLLITVDASDGPGQNSSVNTTIPDNVKVNRNIYQTSDSGSSSTSESTNQSSSGTSGSSSSDSGSSDSPGSNGGPNTAADANKTTVNNYDTTSPGITHSNIDEKNKANNIQTIKNFMTKAPATPPLEIPMPK